MRTSAIILSITVATTVVTLGCDGGFTSLDEEQQPREGELEPNDDDDDKPTDEQPVDEEDPAPVVPLALGLETPLPSDTIFDDDGGLDPDLHTGLNDVERALLEQVRGARGWPAEVTPALPSLDSLDELPFDAADARPVLVQFPLGELPFTVELSGDIVRLLPERPLVRAREYAFGWMVPGGAALGLEDGPRASRDAAAAMLDELGLDGGDLVLGATFTVHDEGSVEMDARHKEMGLPNDLLVEDGRIHIPVSAGVDPRLIPELSERDGFSLTAPITVRTTQNVDAPAPDSLILLEIAAVPVEVTTTTAVPELRELEISHRLPLKAETEYVTLVTSTASAYGERLLPSLHAAALNLELPLESAARSTARFLSDRDAVRLEDRRDALAPVRTWAATRNIDIVAALPFTTQSVGSEARRRRESLVLSEVSVEPHDVTAAPAPFSMQAFMNYTQSVIQGKITTLDYMDPVTRDDALVPEEREIDFIFTIPDSAVPGEPMPTVVFGHGLTMSRELIYFVANFLGQAGYAVFAVDLPLHGDRSLCTLDEHCQGQATCDDIGYCRNPDGSRGELIEGSSAFLPDGIEMPETTGLEYVNLESMSATRVHVLQSLVDLSQATRVLREADWANIGPGFVPDGDDLVFMGISLGSTIGVSYAAIEPNIQDYALNVPGGGMVDLIMTSERYAEEVDPFLAQKGWARGGSELRRYMRDAKWIIDDVEPVNLQREVGPPPRMLLQMAIGDTIIPNASTELLAETSGGEMSSFDAGLEGLLGHGFIVRPFYDEAIRCRQQILDFFAAR